MKIIAKKVKSESKIRENSRPYYASKMVDEIAFYLDKIVMKYLSDLDIDAKKESILGSISRYYTPPN